jgi:NADPH:quinone reductase-like Zn-dependent oxidoreductase
MFICTPSRSRFGGPEVLTEVELPDPHPGPGQISINVTHAAVGMIDVIFRRGDRAVDDRFPPPPFVPGIEVAGFVRELGDGVDQFSRSRPVLGPALDTGATRSHHPAPRIMSDDGKRDYGRSHQGRAAMQDPARSGYQRGTRSRTTTRKTA